MPRRGAYVHFRTLQTRWKDVDVYGHVNNVEYYSYFDTAVNAYLVEGGALDPLRDDAFGLVVETSCQFKRSLTFPEPIDVGLRVAKLGTTSVIYEIGIFRQGEDEAAAFGRFVHVYCDRASQRPVPIPSAHRALLEPLQTPPSDD